MRAPSWLRLRRRRHAGLLHGDGDGPVSLRSPIYTDVDRFDVDVPGGDEGVTLRTTVIAPRGAPPGPAILVRSPYGRKNIPGEEFQNDLATRGYRVVLQDTRGRFGSSGDFFPARDEAKDGSATVEWLYQQQWCNGKIGLWGVSYLGFTAWSIMGSPSASKVSAVVNICTQSRLRSVGFLPGGGFALELLVLWSWLVFRLLPSFVVDGTDGTAEQRGRLRKFVSKVRSWCHFLKLFVGDIYGGRLKRAFSALPLSDIDVQLLGRHLAFVQEGLATEGRADDPWWADMDVLAPLDASSASTAPTLLIAGWQDIFLEEQLRDYERLVALGASPRLNVFSVSHFGLMGVLDETRAMALEHFDQHLMCEGSPAPLSRRSGVDRGQSAALLDPDLPVKVAVQDSEDWHGFSHWPPPMATEVKSFLSQGLRLIRAEDAPADASASPLGAYIFDPSSPTPCLGGPSFNFANSGRRKQGSIEARKDVLTFAMDPMGATVFVAGRVWVELAALVSGVESVDFIARLCIVAPGTCVRRGNSINVCEGMVRCNLSSPINDSRIREPEQVFVRIELGSTCLTVPAGASLRLQICSGAHPRWSRNLGLQGPIGAVRATACAHVQILPSLNGRRSHLTIPVVA